MVMECATRPSLEDQHPVGQFDRLVHVMGDQQDAESVPAPQVEQQRPHGQPGERVQRAERLVEQQQLRFGHQCARQRNPLRLTAGQSQRPGLGVVGEADLGQRPLAARSGRLAGQRGAGESVLHVGQHVAPREQPRLLKGDSGSAADLSVAGVVVGKPCQHA